MKASKIIDEILENNPELKGKEKELNKIVNTLIKSNPNIKADRLFKQKLKNKLDTVIGIKAGVKSNKITFAFFNNFINIFGAVFVVFGLYYFTSDITFFNNNKDVIFPIDVIKSESYNNIKLKNRDIQILKDELLEIDKIILQEQGGINSIEKNQLEENSKAQDSQILPAQTELNNNIIDLSQGNKIDDDSIRDIIEVDNIIDTQIIDLLSEPEIVDNPAYNISINKIDNFSVDSIIYDLLDDDDNNSGSIDNIIEEDNFEDQEDNINDDDDDENISDEKEDEDDNLEILISFKEFCKSIGGEIFELNKKYICRIKEKECKKSEYKNGTCEFFEKK